jgi:hypothetical protein
MVSEVTLRLTLSDIAGAVLRGDMVPETQRRRAQRVDFLDYFNLPPGLVDSVRKRLHYVVLLDRLAPRISFRNSSGAFSDLVGRIAMAIGDPKPRHPTTLYDLLCRYRRSGRDPGVFAMELVLKRKRGPRNVDLHDLTRTVILENYRKGVSKPTNEDIRDEVLRRYSRLSSAKSPRKRAEPDDE